MGIRRRRSASRTAALVAGQTISGSRKGSSRGFPIAFVLLLA
jgi:hypothetical protein